MHGPIFIGTPVDIPAKERRVYLPSLRKAREFALPLREASNSRGLPSRFEDRQEALSK